MLLVLQGRRRQRFQKLPLFAIKSFLITNGKIHKMKLILKIFGSIIAKKKSFFWTKDETLEM